MEDALVAAAGSTSVGAVGGRIVESSRNDNGSGPRRARPRPRRKKKSSQPAPEPDGNYKHQEQKQRPPSQPSVPAPQPAPHQENGQRKPRKQASRRRYPWRKHIPPKTVDPITLEDLVSLTYPPFALVASEPYEPVLEWPVPKASQAESQLAVDVSTNNEEQEEERRRRILLEQWGSRAPELLAPDAEHAAEGSKEQASSSQPIKRHYHLYDGRALAYYMVSQLQFIDPLNRRDLTRREIEGLDQYLKKHGFSGLSVTEAYDKRGTTVSTAGAAGSTAAGRAAILQQEATQLLNALFVTSSDAASASNNRRLSSTSTESMSQLRAQYQVYDERQQQPSAHPRRFNRDDDDGVYGHGGLYIIDDTMNPNLRGVASDEAAASGSLWSARHITSQFRSVTPQPVDFPALAETVERNPVSEDTSAPARSWPPKKPAATLTAITKVVKKTSPEEIQRQREARDEALRRAAAANLPFGATLQSSEPTIPLSVTAVTDPVISESLVERNMALADALGIKTERASAADEKCVFADELISVIYPDSLLLQARERPGFLSKLERKWIQLVKDESRGSLSLTPMDRPTRVFVHEYSDFWNFHTESFDPEGRRYIHCRKQLNTRIPHPLLSVALRNWKGPTINRSLPTAPTERAPLPLRPRTVASLTDPAVSSKTLGIPLGGMTTTRAMLNDADEVANSRVAGLVCERPKLQLQQRSLPMELPPIEAKKEFDVSSELERQQQRSEEKLRKEKERKAREQRALEAAFASDDEKSLNSCSSYRGAW